MDFEKIKHKRAELKAILEIQNTEKQRFSDLSAKCQKEISRYEEMIASIYQGSEAARCQWIWENGSIKDFSYELTEKDKIDIAEISKCKEEESVKCSAYSDKSRACKARIAEIESNLPYSLLHLTITDYHETVDDKTFTDGNGNVKNSSTYGEDICQYQVDLREFSESGNVTLTTYQILNYPTASQGFKWRLVTASGKETPVDKDPKWDYLIRTYLCT